MRSWLPPGYTPAAAGAPPRLSGSNVLPPFRGAWDESGTLGPRARERGHKLRATDHTGRLAAKCCRRKPKATRGYASDTPINGRKFRIHWLQLWKPPLSLVDDVLIETEQVSVAKSRQSTCGGRLQLWKPTGWRFFRTTRVVRCRVGSLCPRGTSLRR